MLVVQYHRRLEQEKIDESLCKINNQCSFQTLDNKLTEQTNVLENILSRHQQIVEEIINLRHENLVLKQNNRNLQFQISSI